MLDAERIIAVIPAAGLSRRMGQLKPLLPFGPGTLLEHVITGLSTHAQCILVVSGHASEQVEPIARACGAACIFNPQYATGGMISSIKTAIARVKGECDAILLALVDQPLVSTSTISRTIETWRATRAPMVLPAFMHQRGHPVVIDSSGFDEILSLGATETLKTFRLRNMQRVVQVDVDDPAILYDLDTPEDYQRALKQLSDRSVSCPF